MKSESMSVSGFFCQQPIVGKASRHHLKPKRYFGKRQDHRKGNIVKSCHECHMTFHMHYDNSKWTWREFEAAMKPLKFGERIFAGD